MWKLLLGSWVGEQCRVCRLNIASAEVDSKLKQNTSCSFNGMYEHAQLDTAVCFVPRTARQAVQAHLNSLVLFDGASGPSALHMHCGMSIP